MPIKFGDRKVKTIQIGNVCFVAVRHIGIALDVIFDTLQDIVRNHLTQQYNFSRNKIGIDISDGGSKLSTAILGGCRVILGQHTR